MKRALITGITGQDGAYLAELLLKKNYEVHGIKRRASQFNTDRIDHLYQDPHESDRRFVLHYGDLTDSTNLIRIVQQVQPDEIYNLAAQSHVQVSFETPEYTANADALGTLRLLEAIRILGLEKKTKFYQASTSELYGLVQETPQTEKTPFYPRSPYAAAKLYAYWITVNYREAYGIFGCNGILFNHESPIRGETFVTRKITRGLARIKLGFQDCLYLGNLDGKAGLGTRPGLRGTHASDASAGRAQGLCYCHGSAEFGSGFRQCREQRGRFKYPLGGGGALMKKGMMKARENASSPLINGIIVPPRWIPFWEMQAWHGRPWAGNPKPPLRRWWRRWWPRISRKQVGISFAGKKDFPSRIILNNTCHGR